MNNQQIEGGMEMIKIGKIIFSVALVLSAFSLSAFAETQNVQNKQENSSPYAGPKFHRLEGQFLAICDTEKKLCSRVKMPKSLGKVEKIFPGPFLGNTKASWIAFSKFDSFLCALIPNSLKVVCAKMDAGPLPVGQISSLYSFRRKENFGY